MKLFRGHMDNVKGRVHQWDYFFFDDSDIQKLLPLPLLMTKSLQHKCQIICYTF